MTLALAPLQAFHVLLLAVILRTAARNRCTSSCSREGSRGTPAGSCSGTLRRGGHTIGWMLRCCLLSYRLARQFAGHSRAQGYRGCESAERMCDLVIPLQYMRTWQKLRTSVRQTDYVRTRRVASSRAGGAELHAAEC